MNGSSWRDSARVRNSSILGESRESKYWFLIEPTSVIHEYVRACVLILFIFKKIVCRIFDALSFLFSVPSTGDNNKNKKEGDGENARSSESNQSNSLDSNTAHSHSTAYQQAKAKKKSPRSTTMDAGKAM